MFRQNRMYFPLAMIVCVALRPSDSPGQQTEDPPRVQVEYQPVTEFQPVPPVTEIEYRQITEFDAAVDLVHAARELVWTGVELAAVDPALRSQLDLAEDEGIVVVSVEPDSPASEAGIEAHDVLLAVDGAAVRDEETLKERIGASESEAVSVMLLRGGKRLSLELTPRPREWSVVTFQLDPYRIGVGVAIVDESLRAQLGLVDGRGLVVTEVREESPAAEAGLEQHDILLEFGGKPLRTMEDLTSQIQEVGDRPATMELLRRGVAQRLRVTPARELIEAAFVNQYEADLLVAREYMTANATGGAIAELVFDNRVEESVEQQLERLVQELESLTRRMETLQQSIRESASGNDESEGTENDE